MKKTHFFLIFLCFCAINASAQNKNNELLSFMVYGKDFLTSIALPDKWNVDMAAAQRYGVNGFFYLRNNNTDDSPAVIVLSLEYNKNKTFEEWIGNDINEFIDYYKDFSVELLNWNVINKKGYRIIVYSLKHKTNNILQYSAYIDAGLPYFVNIYITIKNQGIHNEMVNDFKLCLENSTFTGIGVKVIE